MTTKREQPTDEQDDVLQQVLKSLPDQPAPPALLPRVMSTALARAAQQRMFRQRLRWISGPAAAVAAGILFWLGNRFYEVSLVPILDRGIAVARAVSSALAGPLIETVPWSGFSGVVLSVAGVLLVIMYFTCIGLGSFVYRAVRR